MDRLVLTTSEERRMGTEAGQMIFDLLHGLGSSGVPSLKREILSHPDSVFRHLTLALDAILRQLGVVDTGKAKAFMFAGASFAEAVSYYQESGR